MLLQIKLEALSTGHEDLPSTEPRVLGHAEKIPQSPSGQCSQSTDGQNNALFSGRSSLRSKHPFMVEKDEHGFSRDRTRKTRNQARGTEIRSALGKSNKR
jgi:hypothetical protein